VTASFSTTHREALCDSLFNYLHFGLQFVEFLHANYKYYNGENLNIIG